MGGSSTPGTSSSNVTSSPYAPAAPYIQGALQQLGQYFGMGNNSSSPGTNMAENPALSQALEQANMWGINLPSLNLPSSGNNMGSNINNPFNSELQDALSKINAFGNSPIPGMSPDVQTAENYLSGVVKDPTTSGAYKAAVNQIIPSVQSNFNAAGALNSGAAKTAQTGAIADAYAKTQTDAANQLQNLGFQQNQEDLQQQLARLQQLTGGVDLSMIPEDQLLKFLGGLQGFMTNKSETGTETQPSGDNPFEEILGTGLLLPNLIGGFKKIF